MSRPSPLELWGGLECTIARVGDVYRDQFAETGHHERIEDLDLVAGLGIRTLRYPVLWECLGANGEPGRGWDWHDRRLARLRELGVRPILGLIHHGSGPRGTDLTDPGFPEGLASHARAVAERYPWADLYTPVNEPLTTARFAALYGHWYPHGRSYPDFLRAVVNQCRAVTLAMEEIRRVNPGAALVQTEDIGRIFSTEAMAYQAEHENGRRWLSLDLLFGAVGPDHPWWRILLDHGIGQEELEAFLPIAPPDIVGVNHYLTSDRFLDEDIGAYPEHLWGENGRDRYADAEAVRVPGLEGWTGPTARLREVAARYAAPIAVTEVHHGCTREEQLRWLHEVWEAARTVQSEGADIRAVTLWSMMGAVDWNSLLTRREGVYEPGIFDVRGPAPRPTALARAAAALARTGRFDHPVLARHGWWRRVDRFYGRARVRPPFEAEEPTLGIVCGPGPFLEECRYTAARRGLALEILDPNRPWLGGPPSRRLWAVLDASGAEGGVPDFGALRTRVAVAARSGLPYGLLSRPDVFARRTGEPCLEGDAPVPDGSAGGRSLDAETELLEAHPAALVIRPGLLFGPGGERGPSGGRIPDPHGVSAQRVATAGFASYVPDLIHVALDLLVDRETGIWHLANPLGGETRRSRPGSRSPVLLAAGRGVLMPPMESALARWAAIQSPEAAPEQAAVLEPAE